MGSASADERIRNGATWYFQEAGDDPSSAENRYLYYRWWSRYGQLLQRGRFVLVVRLEPQFWDHVLLGPGDENAATAAGFQQALANPQSIGIMCRGGYVAKGGHVGDKPSDDYWRALVDPTFMMFSFAVCDPDRTGPTNDADAPSAKQVNISSDPALLRTYLGR